MSMIDALKRAFSGVSPRTTFEESPRESKAVRRYGPQGSKIDATYKSTGGHTAHESDIAPSVQARHVGHIGPARVEQVGHAVDGSGRFISPTFDKELIGNAIQVHAPLRPAGQMKDANSKFGQRSKVPASKNESYRTRMDAGALAGESGERTSYTGGKGPIRP